MCRNATNAVGDRQKEYASTLINGFSLPLVSVVAKSRDACDIPFDHVCSAVRTAFAGCIVYLKQFRYASGYEAYFVIDLAADRIAEILNGRFAGDCSFELFDIRLRSY